MHNIPHTEEAKRKMRVGHLGKHHSPETEFKKGCKPLPVELRNLPTGENHYRWTNNPSYSAIHAWVRKKLGKPLLCAKCGFSSENNRQFNWANLSGKYRREVDDWIRLCVKCHHSVDKISERGWATRKKQCESYT